jgi:hypothetical protein
MRYELRVKNRGGKTKVLRGRCRSLVFVGNTGTENVAVRVVGTGAELCWLLMNAQRGMMMGTGEILFGMETADVTLIGRDGGETRERLVDLTDLVLVGEGFEGELVCLYSPDEKMTAFMIDVGRAKVIERLLYEPRAEMKPTTSCWQ